MHIAVEGCCHGELNKIYETLQYIESKENLQIELLLCCGDFQAVRNEKDLMCMACPDKHKAMQDFWEYYSGKKTAPYLTIFIGGNHEASNYLQELPYGGWVAPRIYFLGYANVINYKGLKIGGLSGIFKQHDYTKGHYEKPPYTPQSMRSVYHIRHLEVFKLKQLRQPIDIMMSHDWPNGVVEHGDKAGLLAKKRFFEGGQPPLQSSSFLTEDVSKGQLGSLPAWTLLNHLRPKYWFSGHLHVKFAALIKHEISEDETTADLIKNKVTRFLALDKCLPRRDFLQILEIDSPVDAPDELYYDAEWLAVLKNTNELMSTSYKSFLLPTEGLDEKCDFSVDQKKINEILEIFDKDLRIPLNFYKDQSCVYDPENSGNYDEIACRINPQTTEFCAKLTINDPVMMLIDVCRLFSFLTNPILTRVHVTVQSESGPSDDVSFNSSSWMSEERSDPPSHVVSNISINPEEIALDDDSDETDDVRQPNEVIASEMKMINDKSDDANTLLPDSEKVASSEIVSMRRPRLAANFSMKLPAPKCSTPLPSSTTDEERCEVALSSSFLAPPSSAEEEQTDPVAHESDRKAEPSVKKFKRRNASIYSESFQAGEDT